MDNADDSTNPIDTKHIKPFFKWAGNKYHLIEKITKHFPTKYNRYIEPFVGAGAVAFNIQCNNILINDSNKDLINTYLCLQQYKESFIADCNNMFITENNTLEQYTLLRKEFNETTDIYRKSILFVYLNRHCFNGLCRYSGKKGNFNVPMGRYKNPQCPIKQMTTIMPILNNFKIKNVDYKEILTDSDKGDIVYCDPPYLPLSDTSSFTSYTKEDFLAKEHIELAMLCYQASIRGATVIVSNHWTPLSEQLYTTYKAECETFEVKRVISGRDSNFKAQEVLAVFKAKK